MAREMEKRIEDVCSRILISSRNELYIHLRFFDVALSAFTYVMGEQNGELGTDGVGIYYDPGYLGGLYRQGRREVNRAYLHMMLHCLLAHLWKKVRIRKKLAAKALGISREDEENGQEDLTDILWDLACDISVESIIDGLALHCVKKPMSRDRKNLYASLRKKRKTFLFFITLTAFLIEGKKAGEQKSATALAESVLFTLKLHFGYKAQGILHLSCKRSFVYDCIKPQLIARKPSLLRCSEHISCRPYCLMCLLGLLSLAFIVMNALRKVFLTEYFPYFFSGCVYALA